MTVTIIGYARASSALQDTSLQESALRAAGCDIVRAEKRSGTTTAGHEELRTVLDFMPQGDVLMVTRIDRLARSIGDLQDMLRRRRRGAPRSRQPSSRLTPRRRPGSASSTCWACSRSSNLRKERQLEGIAKARPRASIRVENPR
jgi:DNA invertase Pin-like site-specific DNA recombinase